MKILEMGIFRTIDIFPGALLVKAVTETHPGAKGGDMDSTP